MTQLRLLHLVFLSAGALVLFKAVGLIAETGFVLTPVLEASAQDAGSTPEPDAQTAPGEVPGDAAEGESGDQPDTDGGVAVGPQQAKPDGKLLQAEDLGRSRSERAVLERLRERRKELDAREARQQLREDLLKAAEARIEQRVAELKELEQRIGVAVEAKKAQEAQDFKNLARMYEAMKAKDAARIFDLLELGILVKVARAMKPDKMADVMAKMSADAAERLTVEMATGGDGRASLAAGELPKIQGN